MSSQSPSTVLYSSDGYELAVVPGAALPAHPRAILIDGSDGVNAHTILTDSSGRQVVVGAGTAGSQAGGVITIQGDPSGTPVPVSGTVAVSSISGTVAVTQSTSPWVVSGTVTTSPNKSTTGTITSVGGSTSSVTLLAANANRVSATIFNDTVSGDILYVALSATSSITAFTFKLFPNSYWELPVDYTGAISGFWVTGSGNARITELT